MFVSVHSQIEFFSIASSPERGNAHAGALDVELNEGGWGGGGGGGGGREEEKEGGGEERWNSPFSTERLYQVQHINSLKGLSRHPSSVYLWRSGSQEIHGRMVHRRSTGGWFTERSTGGWFTGDPRADGCTRCRSYSSITRTQKNFPPPQKNNNKKQNKKNNNNKNNKNQQQQQNNNNQLLVA